MTAPGEGTAPWAAADPDRAAALTLLPPPERTRLAALHALDFELGRAARASAEPMLNEIRLQWWIDALAALPGSAGLHPLLAELAGSWEAAVLAGFAEGGRLACDPAARWDPDAALAAIDATAGALAWCGAAALGAPPAAEAAVRAQGRALGVAAALAAGGPEALRPAGRAAAARAAAAAATVPRAAAPVLFVGAARARALAGAPAPSEFSRRAALLRFAVTRDWRLPGAG